MDNIFNKYTEKYSVKSFNKRELTDDHKQKVSDEDIIYTNDDVYSTKMYDISYKLNGDVGYMCPNCFTVQHINTCINNNAHITFPHVTDDDIVDIESDKIKLSIDYSLSSKCPICKYYKSHVILDNNIADAIGMLNIKGYVTSSSCEGRKTSDGIIDPYIGFNTLYSHYSSKTVSRIEDYIESTLPLSWYIDRPNYMVSYTYNDYDTMACVRKRKFIPAYIIYHFTIKADYYNKEEALYDILKWTRSLPDIKEGGLM